MAGATLDTLAVEMEYLKADIIRLEAKIDRLDIKVEKYYLTIKQFESEFKPIRNIIYAMVGTILLSVLSALLYIVINRGGS